MISLYTLRNELLTRLLLEISALFTFVRDLLWKSADVPLDHESTMKLQTLQWSFCGPLMVHVTSEEQPTLATAETYFLCLWACFEGEKKKKKPL